MDVGKKSVILGLTLLAFCVLVETMGFCKFKKMFPPKEGKQLIKNDPLHEDEGKNEANKTQTATTARNSLTENVTMARQELSPKASITSPQTSFDHHSEDTTHDLTEVDSATSPPRAEITTSSVPKLQNGDNMTKGKPSPTTLHETPLIKASPDLFLSSSVQNATVASSTVYVVRSTIRTGGANSQGANRSEAHSECKGDSSHLVFIESKEENDFLIGETGNNTEYWIGIHQRPNLFWDNGNQVTFANIDPDNSNTFNDGAGCYVMSENDERKWLGKQCSEYYSYICEYEGAGCPSGYAITYNTSCYMFIGCGLRATWSEARSACQSDSSHLVFIETKELNDFLVREAECNGQYWIGIHERPNLFWNNANQVTFANIYQHDKYTFNDGTGCYRMYKGGNRYWFDALVCAARYHFICEHEGDECPQEYTSKHSASCYKFADSKATLSEARSACRNASSHLVFIETEEENDFLIREATIGNEYWIGIHERPHLFWDNGNQVTFANIVPDDTDSLRKRNGCYSMFNNTKRYWRDSSCSHKHGYICEYEH